MGPRRRIFLLITIMISTSLFIEMVAIGILYQTAFNEERARLEETAKSQARLIEAMARFDFKYSRDYPEGPEEATLSKIVDAHNQYKGFGKTGEFTLSKKDDDNIIFLVSHRHGLQNPIPTPFDSELAEPMRRALSGRSGTVVALDYRGVKVLAAYEPVAELDLGIVAKIDLDEIRTPFIRAAITSFVIGILIIAIGASFFIKVTNPLIRKLEDTVAELKEALGKVKTLSGFLPICASCKKIRDDRGYWNQIESYIRDHSEAEFSHGICPGCARDLYPELFDENGNYLEDDDE